MKKNYFTKYEEYKKINEENIKKSSVSAANVKPGKYYFMPGYLTNAFAEDDDSEDMIKVKILSKEKTDDGGYDVVLQLPSKEKEEHYYTGVEEDFFESKNESINEVEVMSSKEFKDYDKALKRSFGKVDIQVDPLYPVETSLSRYGSSELQLSIKLNNGIYLQYNLRFDENLQGGKEMTLDIKGFEPKNEINDHNVSIVFDKDAELTADYLIKKANEHLLKSASIISVVVNKDREIRERKN